MSGHQNCGECVLLRFVDPYKILDAKDPELAEWIYFSPATAVGLAICQIEAVSRGDMWTFSHQQHRRSALNRYIFLNNTLQLLCHRSVMLTMLWRSFMTMGNPATNAWDGVNWLYASHRYNKIWYIKIKQNILVDKAWLAFWSLWLSPPCPMSTPTKLLQLQLGSWLTARRPSIAAATAATSL